MGEEQIVEKRPNGTLELTGEATLTKREQFAMAAMSGWNANAAMVPTSEDHRYIVGISVSQADELIARLDKGGSDE